MKLSFILPDSSSDESSSSFIFKLARREEGGWAGELLLAAAAALRLAAAEANIELGCDDGSEEEPEEPLDEDECEARWYLAARLKRTSLKRSMFSVITDGEQIHA